jgi:cytochrome c6
MAGGESRVATFTEWSLKMKHMNIQFLVLATALAVVPMVPSAMHAQSAAATYKARCAGCHGADGKGNTAPAKALGAHDFGSDAVTKMSDTDLITIVTAGKNKMPAYGKSLKDTEIKDLVAYVRELGKQK